jgi:hypothetical protein
LVPAPATVINGALPLKTTYVFVEEHPFWVTVWVIVN